MFRWKMAKTKKTTRAEREKYPDVSTEAVRALIGEKTIFKDKWLHVTPDGNFIGLWEIMPAFRKDMVISLFGSCDKLPSPKKKLPVTPEMENCCFPVAAITTTTTTTQRCRSSTPPPPANRRSHVKTKTSKLQTLRPEDSAKCKKILKYNGYTNKVGNSSL